MKYGKLEAHETQEDWIPWKVGDDDDGVERNWIGFYVNRV